MLFGLVKKTLRSRYKASFLGFLWTFVNPLLQLAVYATIFPFILRVQIPNYAMFLFVALLPWTSFVTSLNGSLGAIVNNVSLVKKIYFPRLILPLSVATTYIVDYIYCIPIVILAIIISKIPLTVYILFLPIIVLIQFIFASSLCMLISALNVKFRDLEQIIGILTLAWLYFTPILYDISMFPVKYQKIILLCNPMAGIIGSYRDIIFYGKMPNLFALASAFTAAVVLFIIGFYVFQKCERTFAEDL